MRAGNAAVLAAIALTMVGQTMGISAADAHEQLEWTSTVGCLVDFVKTPCRTVRFREYSFGSGLGFDGITSVEGIEAVDQQGSEAKVMKVVRRRFWLLPSATTTMVSLLLRDQNRTVHVDHDRKVFAAESGAAGRGSQYWEQDDSQCSHAKSHYLYLSERLRNSIIAGIHVVGYGGRDDRGADYKVYFAPSIGCQPLRFVMVMRGFLGLPVAKYERIVDSFELGAPSLSLFTIPAEYKRISLQDLTESFNSGR
jgi:hypothetical protein